MILTPRSEKKSADIEIRVMAKEELQLAMSWAKDEGWNPGKYDIDPYYVVDPQGFLVLLLDNQPIGSIALVRYSKNFAFVGLFIVKKEYRAQGYGKMLWQEMMRRLENCSTVGLYSVSQQVSRYNQSGFESRCSNSRWESSISETIDNNGITSKNIQCTENMLPNVVEYDQRFFPASRYYMFEKMFNNEHMFARVSLDEEGKIDGYGVIRPCQEGYRMGPLYADTPEIAKALAISLLKALPSQKTIKFFVDIPRLNKFSYVFTEYFQLERVPQFDTEVMFKGETPSCLASENNNCYGVVSLEIG